MSETENITSELNNIELAKLIQKRIDFLRPKLLDLTRRNPLISTKFSERSNSLIRIVDEVPELILGSIISDKMRIVPLPDLKIDPKDEQTREFQSALAEARLNDDIYLTRLDEIDQDSDEAPNLLAQAERQLKDMLREKLNMPPRQTKNNLSLQQHAKNHGICPHYELPQDDQQHEDGRHTDTDIQTLLLPDVLERRLNALCSKERTWEEETGISVLHGAFGFLEWEDGNNSSSQFSPLLLLPVQIEKKRTRRGQEFWVHSDEGEVQENKILAEKLRLEFSITLPEYDGQGLEKYFNEVAKQAPKDMIWRIRRWATIGVFPSARLAMYHDLDPEGWDFASHDVVSGLFGGSDTGHDAVPFGDDYNIDEPEIESKVPYLITDADCSQFSAIVDVLDGKSCAVEGPPGTGKSQTIVNTIAASLAAGKKVLFVAEKSAALEVVRARLEALNIGNFLLPLQANRASKEQVISSIRDRIEMKPCANPSELDHALKKFKETRVSLKSYIDILSSHYSETGLTIHTILWRSVKFSDLINGLPEIIKGLSVPVTKKLSPDKLDDILFRCEQVEEAYSEILKHPDYWKSIQVPNIDPFKANDLLDLAKKTSELFDEADSHRQGFKKFKLSQTIPCENLEPIKVAISKTPDGISGEEIDVAEKLSSTEVIELIQNYLRDACSWRKSRDAIIQYLVPDLDEVSVEDLTRIKEILEAQDLTSLKEEDLDSVISRHQECLADYKQANEIYKQALKASESFSTLTTSLFVKVIDMVASLSRQTLAVRKDELDDPSLQTIFIKQVQRVKSLKEKKVLVEEEFVLSSIPEPETINRYLSTLSSAGMFSFLSSEYRNAKKFYRSISKNTKFKKAEAISQLIGLSEWKTGLDDFCGNEAAKNILGLHFDGIDTDFTPFEEAISFFQQIDEVLPGKNYAEIRKFLKHSDNEKVQCIPSIGLDNPMREINECPIPNLANELTKAESKLQACETDIAKIRSLKTIFINPDEISKDDVISLPEQVVKLLEERDALRGNSQAEKILGKSFQAEESDESELEVSLRLGLNLVNLEKESRNALLYCIRHDFLQELVILITQVTESDEKAFSLLKKMTDETNSSQSEWIEGKSYKNFSVLLALASKDKEGLIAYSRFIAAKKNMQKDGYKPLIEAIFSEGLTNIREITEALIIRDMARESYKIHGESLASYNGSNLNLLRRRLQEADRKVIKLSRQRLQSELFYKSRPPMGKGSGRKSEYTELALLKHQASLQRSSASARSLVQRASKALLELKPCWMMSPLAVAQYLPRGGIEFDLVIIDEASQMTPEDSVGALIRAKQAMVVGDTNQLPPTGFFRKVLEDEEVDEDEKTTEESILEMANGFFKPVRRLRWHYRSRNAGLISFSNKHVYNNDLVVFPSAQEDHPDMGVSYLKVDGLYSSGANPKEASAMVDGIITFMREHKDKSLGIVLLNKKQRDLLNDEMNYALEQYPHARKYIETWEERNDGLESFFIKNLENVQGDQRDVIFIGTVYGAEKEGAPVMQRFGPINGIAGKRRLNVLFSRAKERIVTFSSITASDIKAEEDGNPGVHMLKCWLEYASSGILESGEYSEKEPDSKFEEHVIKQIKSIGCEAVPQVGVKGYSIDIGVKHPDWPHGFIMGVECDGATYHSSKSARDRDRLRQEVLEGLGWHLYRIWSTDWFEDPRQETEKLRKAINERMSELEFAKKQVKVT